MEHKKSEWLVGGDVACIVCERILEECGTCWNGEEYVKCVGAM